MLIMYDLCDKVHPGDEVTAIGTLIGRWAGATENLRPGERGG